MFLATQTQHISISRWVFFLLCSQIWLFIWGTRQALSVCMCMLSLSISQVAYSEKPFPSWHSPISSLQLCADVRGNGSDMFLSQNYNNTIQLNYCTLNTSVWLLQTSTFILKLNMRLFCVRRCFHWGPLQKRSSVIIHCVCSVLVYCLEALAGVDSRAVWLTLVKLQCVSFH